MSRNVRQKYPRTPVQATKRRGSDSSSTPNLSDDDGYSGVEDVSDSEDDDDEAGVDAAEEEHIITSELHPYSFSSSPRPGHSDDDEDADGEEDDDDIDEALLSDDDDADDGGSWNGIISTAETSDAQTPGTQASTPVKRQVRFAGVPDSDSDSDSDSTTSETTEDNSAFFPDIFVNQASLDPSFRREIEQESDNSSNSSYWDFNDTYGRLGHLIELSSDDDDVGPGNSEAASPIQSGDEDQDHDADGETTEEDTPEPPARKMPHSRPLSASESSDSEANQPKKPRHKRRPRGARFDLDDTTVKPVAFVHPGTKKLIIVTPEKTRGFDLAPECFHGEPLFQPHNQLLSSPITSHSGSLMMSAMVSSSTFGDFINSLPFAPLEAFMPLSSPDMGFMGFDDDSDNSAMFVEEDGYEAGLKLEDFIKFEDNDTADEAETPVADSPNWNEEENGEPAATPDRRPSTALSTASDVQMEMHPLTAHFENTCDVGAFRRDQANRQLITSKALTSDSLEFSGPLSIGTLKGIKGGSLDAVTVPLTPVRKQKRDSIDNTHEINKSPIESMIQKRKASGALNESSHKRHRSISEVGTIAL